MKLKERLKIAYSLLFSDKKIEEYIDKGRQDVYDNYVSLKSELKPFFEEILNKENEYHYLANDKIELFKTSLAIDFTDKYNCILINEVADTFKPNKATPFDCKRVEFAMHMDCYAAINVRRLKSYAAERLAEKLVEMGCIKYTIVECKGSVAKLVCFVNVKKCDE